MEIKLMTETHELWDAVKVYAAECGWSSGKILAEVFGLGKSGRFVR